MNIRTLDDALNFAIDREENTARLYRTMAQETKNPQTGDLLMGFAIDEETHKRKLQIIKKNHTARYFKNDHQISFHELSQEESPDHHDMDFEQALVFALRLKQKTIKLYLDLADSLRQPELKSFFRTLAREEADHEHRLENIYHRQIQRTHQKAG